jgi:hypothetical protein
MTKMVSHYKLPMTLIKVHASYIAIKNVFEDPHRFSCLGIPNLDRSLTSNVELKSDRRKQSTLDWIVIGGLRDEGLCVLKYLEHS